MSREYAMINFPEVRTRRQIVLLIFIVRKVLLEVGDAFQSGLILGLDSVFIVQWHVDRF